MSTSIAQLPRARTALGAKGEDLSIKDSLVTDFARMASGFWVSCERNRLMMLAAGLTAVTSATAYAQIRLNAWNKPFYDALTSKDLSAFWKQLGVFAGLAGVLLELLDPVVLDAAQMELVTDSPMLGSAPRIA